MAEYISGQQLQVLERLRAQSAFQADVFRQLVLDGADFTEATLQACQIERCGMANAVFDRARLDEVRISNTSFRQARGERSAWVDVRLRLCDMAGFTLTDSVLNNCRVDETLLAGADFARSTLTGCEFDLCDLMNSSFQNALLVRCRFRDARLGTANLMSCSFEGAQLVDLDLREANLQYVNLSGAMLVRCHLQGANLDGANLEGISLVECQGVSDELLNRVRRAASFLPRYSESPAARAVDIPLESHLERLGPTALTRLSRELLRLYVIEGTGALFSEDRAAALLRQRNLGFADLIRFIKERFQHDEFNQILVEGENVYIRTNAGDVPLTRYGRGGGAPADAARGGAPAVTNTRASANPMGGRPAPAASANSNLSPGVSMANAGTPPPAAPPPAAAASAAFGGSAPAAPPPTRVENSRPAPPPPPPAARPQVDDDAFEPDRFGMIDL